MDSVLPVDDPPAVNTENGGRTIPVTFHLGDAQGGAVKDLSAVRAIDMRRTACGAFGSGQTDAPVVLAAGEDPRIGYDGNHYAFNWRTPETVCGVSVVTPNSVSLFSHTLVYAYDHILKPAISQGLLGPDSVWPALCACARCLSGCVRRVARHACPLSLLYDRTSCTWAINAVAISGSVADWTRKCKAVADRWRFVQPSSIRAFSCYCSLRPVGTGRCANAHTGSWSWGRSGACPEREFELMAATPVALDSTA